MIRWAEASDGWHLVRGTPYAELRGAGSRPLSHGFRNHARIDATVTRPSNTRGILPSALWLASLSGELTSDAQVVN
jgi:hypothetical protein